MEQFDELLARISEAAGKLAPIPALEALSRARPLAPVLPLEHLLHHLTTAKVHDTYFPFIRFGCMHAARVAAAWAILTRSRARVGVLQDLVGFLTVAWGGGTFASLLASSPPAWLVSPTPWLVYTAVYALLVPTGMASYIVDTAPGLLLNVALAAVDGMTRGVTVTAMPVLLSSSPASPLASTSASAGGAWWAAAVLGAIATNGGGWIASSLGMHRAQWTAGAPPILSGFGFWSTLDVWGAMLSGVVYAALTRTYPALNSLGDVLAACIPDELRDAGLLKRAGGQVVSNDTARAIAVFLLGALFVLRALALQVREWCGAAARARAVKDEIKDTVPLIPATVVKSPVEASPAAASGAKPKKRKNRKGRSPSAAA